jgi:hypothetical protein
MGGVTAVACYYPYLILATIRFSVAAAIRCQSSPLLKSVMDLFGGIVRGREREEIGEIRRWVFKRVRGRVILVGTAAHCV